MAKRIRCPACGARGEVGDGVNFEVRGQFQGRAVEKCLKCGVGVFLEPPFDRAEVIPQGMWTRMQGLSAEKSPGDDMEEGEGDDGRPGT
ncbi:MAG TPA: hypothetical protein VGV63_07890 [Acidimicrobiales bacterium]|nr:hypothetical protein [Acidimicrobiales bacterium]